MSHSVDWATLSGDQWPLINTATSNNNINNKQDYNQYSFTVPANGRYFVSFTQQLGSNAANGYGLTLKIKTRRHDYLPIWRGNHWQRCVYVWSRLLCGISKCRTSYHLHGNWW